jgi:molybdopterin molybdotransferase
LAICRPLEAFEMSLLDAHGATLAEDIYAGERLVLKSGSRIRSTQIGLAASIGRDHLPTRPHPRVVVLSAGPDLVEPGKELKAGEEYETNSWLLTTAVREVGAVAYRVHTIPDDEAQLQAVIEDQLVRADLIVRPLLSQGSSAQDEQATLSDANAFIAVPEGDSNIAAGSDVTVVVLERRYI